MTVGGKPNNIVLKVHLIPAQPCDLCPPRAGEEQKKNDSNRRRVPALALDCSDCFAERDQFLGF